jgi:hypothetical protein
MAGSVPAGLTICVSARYLPTALTTWPAQSRLHKLVPYTFLQVLQHVLDWSDQQPELQQFIAASAPQASRQGAQYVLIGHSRGAKISALVAAGVGAPSEGSAQAQSNSASAVLPVPDQGSALAAQQHAGGGISSDGVGGGSGVNQGVSSKARGDRVAGLILIDPADASYEQVEGPR